MSKPKTHYQVVDEDPNQVGIQKIILTGTLDLALRATGPGEIVVRVEIEGFDEQEISLQVEDDLRINLSVPTSPIREGDLTLFEVEMTVRDADDQIVADFSAEAAVQVSDPSRAFLAKNTVAIANGKGKIPVAVIGNGVELRVTIPFLPAASF